MNTTEEKELEQLKKNPPRLLYCNACGKQTRHNFNRNSFLRRIYVCRHCGTEKAA